MKLSTEEVDAIKISLRKCASEDGCKNFSNGNTVCSRTVVCKRTMNLIGTIEAQQQEIEKLKDDFAALNSLYDVENETFTEIVQKEKELLKEIDQKDTALERAARGVTSIIEQYTTDFTEEELLSDALCPREKVVLEYAKETLEVIEEAIGGEEDV
jgi:ABC-type transporter Mla subunit MlaD